MYDFQSKRLNFEFDSLRPKETWEKKLRRLMTYFEEDTQLRDILITGGDALMSQNKTLNTILEAIYRMAARKRKANQERPEGEKYAELQRRKHPSSVSVSSSFKRISKLHWRLLPRQRKVFANYYRQAG